MKTQYSTMDIVKIFGIPRERLREWLSRGFIKPGIQEASGPGTKALFALDDLYRIMLFKQLVESGTSREMASELVNCLSSEIMISEEFAAVGYRNGHYSAEIDLDLEEDELKLLAGEVRSDVGAEDVLKLIPKWLRERYGLSLWKAFSLFARKVRGRLLAKIIGDRDYVLVINARKAREELVRMVSG
jgi:hypothetical protein